jgi:hypothetical protein
VSRGPAAVGLAVCLATMAACAWASTDSAGDAGDSAAWAAPLPASEPYVVMSDARHGWAVWPSRESWLVLQTTDGWTHVRNATPVGVPTEGGLALSATAGSVAVAVLPYDRLLSSPLLTAAADQTGATTWEPQQLPGAVVDARDSVAVGPHGPTAVLRRGGGTLVTARAGDWATLADPARLAPGHGLRLDSVTWGGHGLGWLTGHATAGSPVAFQTGDDGATWAPLPPTNGGVAALVPCGSGSVWVLPVLTGGGRIVFRRTVDGGRTWRAGGSLAVPAGRTAWGCSGDEVWSLGRQGDVDEVFASTDGGAHWTGRGRAPDGVVDLTPVGGGAGFATTEHGGHAALWSVHDDGAVLHRLRLPGWVATLGGTGSQD